MMHAHIKMALSSAVILLAFCFHTSLASTTASTVSTTTNMTTSSSTSTTNATSSSTQTTSTMTTTTTMMMTTTTLPPYDFMHNMNTAKYELKLTVGPTNASDIKYLRTPTSDEIRMKFEGAFKSVNFESIVLMPFPNDNTTYTLMVTILAENVGNTTIFAGNVEAAFKTIEMDTTFFAIPNPNVTDDIVAQFLNATMDICSAMDVCPLGFVCNSEGCAHMCRMEDCSGHGTCVLSLLANNTAETMCNCDDEYDTEYAGDRCQESSRGRDQIIVILATVLGIACFILLVILIVMCVMQVRKNSKYDMASPTTHTNQAFVGTHAK